MIKVLLIDDEETFCQLLKMNLEALGHFRVSYVCDPRKALDEARKFKPDSVLLDLMMPHMEGSQVAQQLKSDPATAKIPVFYLTALSDGMDAGDPASSSVRGIISKPVMLADLVRQLNAALGRPKQP